MGVAPTCYRPSCCQKAASPDTISPGLDHLVRGAGGSKPETLSSHDLGNLERLMVAMPSLEHPPELAIVQEQPKKVETNELQNTEVGSAMPSKTDDGIASIELDHLPLCPKFGCSFAFLQQFAYEGGIRASRKLRKATDLARRSHFREEKTLQARQNLTMGKICNEIIKPKTRCSAPRSKSARIENEKALAAAAAEAQDEDSQSSECDSEEDEETVDEYFSYAEIAIQNGMQDRRGKAAFSQATHFVSHAWRYDFISFVEALANWIETYHADQDVTYFWVDAFVVNQHQSQQYPQEWWSTRFMQAIGEIGNTILVLEPWHNPVPFTRAWVVWELYCTSVTGARLHLTMRRESLDDFNKALISSFEKVQTALSNVDVADCQAYHQSDQDMIRMEIKRTIGFTKLNELIQTRLSEWLAETAKNRLVRMRNREKIGVVSSTESLASEDEHENSQSLDLVPDRIERFQLQDNLARMLRESGNVGAAEEHFRELLAESETYLGRDHTFTLSCINQLAVTLQKQNKMSEAMVFTRNCLERRRHLYGVTHSDTLQSISNLAVLLSLQKPLSEDSFEEAQMLFRQAIQGRESLGGPNDPATLYTVSNLAKLLSAAPTPSQWLLNDAERLHTRAVEDLRKALHDTHPLTLTAMHNQACHYLAQINFKGGPPDTQLLALATNQLRCVHTLRTEKLGKQHPDTLLSEEALRECRRHSQGHHPKSYSSFAELSLEEFPECRTRQQFKGMRAAIRQYGTKTLCNELIHTGFVDKESRLLTVGMQPFNVFARIACGALKQSAMESQQACLGDYQDRFVIACNKPEADDMWDSKDPAWMGRASMSKRHRLLILKDRHWEWFNTLTFGLLSGLDLGLKKLKDVKAAAQLWVQNQDDWPPVEKVGLFVHIYSHSSVNSFHLHILDMDCLGPTFHKLKYKNLPIDDAISVLEEELGIGIQSESMDAVRESKSARSTLSGSKTLSSLMLGSSNMLGSSKILSSPSIFNLKT